MQTSQFRSFFNICLKGRVKEMRCDDSDEVSVETLPVSLYSRVIFAVGGEGVVCLVTQRGTVSLRLVKRLRDIDHSVLVQ